MLGTSELILILCVALLLFGGKRLPELAKSLGHALSEFRRAMNQDIPPSGGEDRPPVSNETNKDSHPE